MDLHSPSFPSDISALLPNRVTPGEEARLTRPLSVYIAFTNRCKFKCSYCYAERPQTTEMSLTEWIAVFDELQRHGIFIVDIGGTDLFTRSDAIELLQEMVNRQFVFFVSTKSGLSYSTLQRMAHMGIGVDNVPPHLQRPIQVSLDSMDEDEAASLTGKPDALRQALHSIDRMIAVGMKPRVKCVLTSRNSNQMRPLTTALVSRGIYSLHFVQYGRSFYRHDDAYFVTMKQKHALEKEFNQLKQEYPNIDLTYDGVAGSDGSDSTQRFSIQQWDKRNFCSAGRSTMLINPNGDVTLCEQIPHREEHIVGNINTASLMDIWNSERMRNYIYPARERFTGSVCYSCDQFDDCHKGRGRCFREAMFAFGSIYDAPPQCPKQIKMSPRMK